MPGSDLAGLPGVGFFLADADHQFRHARSVFGEPQRVFVRSERIAGLGAVIQLQTQEFLQEFGLVVFGKFRQIGFDSGRLAGFEQRLEFFANAVDADSQRDLGR